MVDKVLFRKAERKIASAKTPQEHYAREQHGVVYEEIHGKKYRLTWSIKRLRAEKRHSNR